MNARLFADVLKDATVQSVHARTALGNQGVIDEKKRRELNALNGADPDEGLRDLNSEDGAADIVKCSLAKVDAELGLVFGFAIVCKRDGQEYFDLQGDHITERAMLGAAADFMLHSRASGEMHEWPDGTVVFAFPLTTDIAKALDITTKQTGLLIAMKPSPEVLAKFKSGEYTGFSIGGCYGSVVEVE
jgi:hypothetical protein